MKPSIVTNQRVVSRINNTTDEAVERSTFFVVNNPIKLPSVTPIPPGKNETVPAKIDVNVSCVMERKVNGKLNAKNAK